MDNHNKFMLGIYADSDKFTAALVEHELDLDKIKQFEAKRIFGTQPIKSFKLYGLETSADLSTRAFREIIDKLSAIGEPNYIRINNSYLKSMLYQLYPKKSIEDLKNLKVNFDDAAIELKHLFDEGTFLVKKELENTLKEEFRLFSSGTKHGIYACYLARKEREGLLLSSIPVAKWYGQYGQNDFNYY